MLMCLAGNTLYYAHVSNWSRLLVSNFFMNSVASRSVIPPWCMHTDLMAS